MASTSESGHSRNIFNFEELISRCTGFGTDYNPSNIALLITALIIIHGNADAANLAEIIAKSNLKVAIKNRKLAFKGLKKLCTKIINALEVCGASQPIIDNAKSINYKIQGQRIIPIELPPEDSTEPIPVHISVSQQSFDSLINNFIKLIQLLTVEPLYIPNEIPLQLASLNAFLGVMETTNTAVIDTETPYYTALIERNRILYRKDTGLVDVALDVKKYVKSVYGTSSPKYKQVSIIKFSRPRPKR